MQTWAVWLNEKNTRGIAYGSNGTTIWIRNSKISNHVANNTIYDYVDCIICGGINFV